MMQLITRCPQCETAFAFEAAQLRLAHGWVRCGKCATLFEADQHLFERVVDRPKRLPFGYDSEQAVPNSERKIKTRIEQLHSDLPALHEALDESSNAPSGPNPSSTPGPASPASPASSSITPLESKALSGAPLGLSSDSSPDAPHSNSSHLESTHEQGSGTAQLAVNASSEVSPGENDNPTSIPKVFFVTLLILVAFGQILWTQKEVIGAFSAQSHLMMQSVCNAFGVQLGWPIEPESLKIESSSFKLNSDESYRVKLRLKNHQDYAVKTPWLELVLVGADENVLVRKVFSVRELEVQEAIAADKDLIISFNVFVDASIAKNVAGYKLDFFYP